MFTQGTPNQTNNPFDIAIEGDGYIKVILPNGEERFTRDGALRLNSQNQLVTVSGYQVTPTIQISADIEPGSIVIGPDGTIQGRTTGAATATVPGG